MAPSAVKSSCPSSHFKASSRTSKHHHERHYVVHDYHDYANEADDPAKTPIRRRKGGVNIPFPIVLHRVLAQVEADGYGHIFGWQPHGRSFLIHKPKQFTDLILPKYFKQNKLTSFQRQLNLYGFNRLTRGLDASGYYHEYFLRDREYLAKRMMRQRIKGTKIKGAASPDAEPDFYAMPYVQPTVDVTKAPAVARGSHDCVLPQPTMAVSLELPLVSSDDMSHGSSDDEYTQGYTVCSGAGSFANTETPPPQQQQEQQEQVQQEANSNYTTTTTTTTTTTDSAMAIESSVPSMTDYSPVYTNIEQEQEQVGIPQEIFDTSDPADALLMDLHSLDPLEDFSLVPKNASLLQQQQDTTLQAMEKDQLLGQMLNHVLDDYFP